MTDFKTQKEHMVKYLIEVGALKTPRIIQAFRSIPRHLFVSKKHLSSAYGDYPLPTLHSQTISQPYTVAVMIEALQPKKGDRVLDIGAGSGWTGALLGHIVGKDGLVVAVDIYPDLAELAKRNIRKTKVKNVLVVCGDGKEGFKEKAPYDCVLINAACDDIPEKVIKQTKIGGRIVAPVNSFLGQEMIVADKVSDKKLKKRSLGSFVFVPLR